MTDDDLLKLYDRLDFQAGQIQALGTIIAALLRALPSPEALRQEIAKAALSSAARTEASTASEEFLAGQRHALESFAKIRV